ncbi:winged helix domain-containing protein [Aestuariivirga sp.]|uniref:winged helix domain-containing protein n=1 Tax=Aestuariivirga sp. TaxID=2650926 RepID=UPI003BABFEA8
MTDKLTVTARIVPDGRAFTVTGRPAETLLSLVEAGPRGITSLEAFQAGWAVRLAAYVHRLRTECGLAIKTSREPHPGGSHGRYILQSPVELMERSEPRERMAA